MKTSVINLKFHRILKTEPSFFNIGMLNSKAEKVHHTKTEEYQVRIYYYSRDSQIQCGSSNWEA